MDDEYEYPEEEPENKPSIRIWVWIFVIGIFFFAIYDNQDWIAETWEENKPSFEFEVLNDSNIQSSSLNVTTEMFGLSPILTLIFGLIPLFIIWKSIFGRKGFL